MSGERPVAGPSPATIATIAHEVGVSTATVSKVLNGRSDVAAATRARVEASLERHRYRRRPRRVASSTAQIELVFHQFSSAWAMEILQGAEAVAAPARTGIVLSQLNGEHCPPRHWVDDVIARTPAGVLFVLCHPTKPQRLRLQRQQIPFVVIDTDSATSASMPTVGSNNWNGGLIAARHLLELGHRRIAVISGPKDVLCSQARLAGFRSALEAAGVELDPDLIRYGNFHIDPGYAYGLELLSDANRPTAIFAGSDMQAMGVLRAARKLGLRVPEDVSVVGYDNVPMATWCGPALTTVNQPLRNMAGTATRMLLDLAHGIEVATNRIDLVTELVVRESTAPPPRTIH